MKINYFCFKCPQLVKTLKFNLVKVCNWEVMSWGIIDVQRYVYKSDVPWGASTLIKTNMTTCVRVYFSYNILGIYHFLS